ncbi:phosphoethanolamine transferase [Hippea alviniae]|uniref:phosphoethanolamine transferase n=1 Tax=Hippea alviniae TaxID=1279027 RepID=UPI0003B31FE0|nr:phosphoethanolamine--lipid A transferase [Hippea alviniae]
MKRLKLEATQTQVIVISTIFMIIAYNWVFFSKSFTAFPNIFFMLALALLLFITITTALYIIANKYTLKPFLIFLFITASLAAYYMQEYSTIINSKMIENIFETDKREVLDLLNIKMFLMLLFLGILPSIILLKTKVKYRKPKDEIKVRLKLFALNLILIPILYFVFPRTWASFFRTHKRLRMYSNPTFYMYSFGEYIGKRYLTKPIKFRHIALDAHLAQTEGKPKLFIFVVGEAARYDHFSLNGYKRDTNPNLEKIKDLLDYPDMHSCGTETAVSVPCMFSPYTRKNFSVKKARHTDSLMDVLKRAGVNVLWRENNSDSKGVAVRIKNYQDFTSAHIKPYCNKFGCYDEVLLYKLQDWINNIHNNRPIFIVLHQMGSHGPAYYKRYPPQFEKFKPVCKTNQLQDCTRQEVINAYDNTILYTDKFLSDVIKFLKKNEKKYRVGMFYVADHGESLGENGIYLHGFPYFIAPDVQKHPASVAWFSKDFGIDLKCAKKLEDKPYSQDYVFDTMLGLMDVKTKIYNPKLDMYYPCREKLSQKEQSASGKD